MNTTHTERLNAILERSKPVKKVKQKAVEMQLIEERENMSLFQRSLSKCTYSETTVYLPKERLENYIDLRKALINAGAAYKNNTFVFPNNAEPFINRLMGGEDVNIKKQFQFFATPPKVAKMVIDKINWVTGYKVGEFSAGQGGLLDYLPNLNLEITCVELMPENAQILIKKGYDAVCEDFLKNEYQMQDVIIGNPPFSKNQDIDHFMHMYKHLVKGGQMSVIMSPHWTFANDKKSVEFRKFLEKNSADDWEDIDQGEFKESGTNIKTVLVYLRKE